MTKVEKIFLNHFDEFGAKGTLDDYGRLTGDLLGILEESGENGWYDDVITEAEIGEVVHHDIVGNGDHHVEMEKVLKVGQRYFRIDYIGVGKDLDEYEDYIMTEVKPKTVSKTIYVDINDN